MTTDDDSIVYMPWFYSTMKTTMISLNYQMRCVMNVLMIWTNAFVALIQWMLLADWPVHLIFQMSDWITWTHNKARCAVKVFFWLVHITGLAERERERYEEGNMLIKFLAMKMCFCFDCKQM